VALEAIHEELTTAELAKIGQLVVESDFLVDASRLIFGAGGEKQ
jgi:hypothetical protein